MERLAGTDLLTKFADCSLTVSDYMERVIDREKLLRSHNFFTYFPVDDLRARAKAADEAYRSGNPRPLEGLPIAIKDNVSIVGQPNSAATKGFWGKEPKVTATIAQKLLDAGAIPTGRTNMHELAAGVTTKNCFTGDVRNFYNIDHNNGGSSGGSSGAVAADIVPAALGTDTGGSVRIPANAGGVYGYRPSIGYWPMDYGIKMTHLRDSCGPMARDMGTIALLDKVVTGNAHDTACPPSSIRIGVPREYYWVDLEPEVRLGCETHIEHMRAAGFDMVESPGPDPDLMKEAHSLSMPQINREAFVVMQEYMDQNGFTDMDIKRDIIDNIASPDVKAFLLPAWENPVSDEEYEKTLDRRNKLKAAFEKYSNAHNLDCWIFPTIPIPPPKLSVPSNGTVRHGESDVGLIDITLRNIDTASIADHPGITMPCGRITQTAVPYGIEIDGLTMNDKRLIDVALAIERAGIYPHHLVRALSRRPSRA